MKHFDYLEIIFKILLVDRLVKTDSGSWKVSVTISLCFLGWGEKDFGKKFLNSSTIDGYGYCLNHRKWEIDRDVFEGRWGT